MPARITAEDPDHPQARACLAAYAALLREQVPGIAAAHVPDPDPEAARYRPPLGIFLIAREGGQPVGCVAVRPFGPGEGEVKRLWVAPEARGQGLARRLMAELEQAARGLGMRHLRLDTNGNLGAALALYRATGWTETAPYTPFPATHWFAKALGAAPPPG